MRVFALLVIGTAGLLATACGPNCQSACGRAFRENECNLQVPGEDQAELFRECVGECEFALRTPGELDGYDPDERNLTGERVVLQNEKQAAAWMDCVDETSCGNLEEGYCPGGGIN